MPTPKEATSVDTFQRLIEGVIMKVPHSGGLVVGVDLEHTLLDPFDVQIDYASVRPTANSQFLDFLGQTLPAVAAKLGSSERLFLANASRFVVDDPNSLRGLNASNVYAYVNHGDEILRGFGMQTVRLGRSSTDSLPKNGMVWHLNDMNVGDVHVRHTPVGWTTYQSTLPPFRAGANPLSLQRYIDAGINTFAKVDTEALMDEALSDSLVVRRSLYWSF